MNLLNLFSKAPKTKFEFKERKVEPAYFKDAEMRDFYIENGYVVVKDVVSEDLIQLILDTYQAMTKMPGYFNDKRLISSHEFGNEIHNFVVERIQYINNIVFKDLFDEDKCMYDLGGSIFIKKSKSKFRPHQDSPLIDERIATTTYAWIPTLTTNASNGALYILPKSHRWASWQRPVVFDYWKFNPFIETIWKYMKPIYINKGDLILFDSSTMHASADNNSNDVRIAMNTNIVSKGYDFLQYYYDKKMPTNKIEKYVVEKSYWTGENIWKRPKQYLDFELEDFRGPTHLTQKELIAVLEKYK